MSIESDTEDGIKAVYHHDYALVREKRSLL